MDEWHFKHANSGYMMPKVNGMYKRNYSFKMNIMYEIFEVRI